MGRNYFPQKKLLWQGQLAPAAELTGTNAVLSRFVYATRANVPDFMRRTGETFRILTDHLGSPRIVINAATGNVLQRIDYDEWGVVLSDTNPGYQPFGFAGGLADTLGLVRFGARDYDPSSGRWTAKDPPLFRAGSPNLVAYSSDDPVNLVDPDGRWCRNNSPFWVPVKPENSAREVEWLAPGEDFDEPVDGARPPAWDGDWFKVSDFTDITIDPDGTASASGPGAILFPPTFPDHILAPTPSVPYPHPTGYDFFDTVPGRKGPGWDRRHPDWRAPEPPADCDCK